MFNEARLRGINLKKLQEESFTSRKHLRMVTEHEAFVKNYWDSVREPERPKNILSQDKVRTVKPPVKVKKSKTYLFSPEQVSIAEAIFRKEKNK